VQKDFKTFIGQREQAQGRSWRLTKEEGMVCFFGEIKEKEEENEVGERLLVLVCGGVHGKVMEKMKHGMELFVASNRGKASGLLV
jgi:hypothetical protein